MDSNVAQDIYTRLASLFGAPCHGFLPLIAKDTCAFCIMLDIGIQSGIGDCWPLHRQTRTPMGLGGLVTQATHFEPLSVQ